MNNELLKKYMRLVMFEESVSYLNSVNKSSNEDAPKFTREEFEVLKSIEKDIDREFYD